jgi:hypothetical protein
MNIATVAVCAANLNTHTDRNGLSNAVGGPANGSTVRVNIIAVIISVDDDNTRTGRAGVWFR